MEDENIDLDAEDLEFQRAVLESIKQEYHDHLQNKSSYEEGTQLLLEDNNP